MGTAPRRGRRLPHKARRGVPGMQKNVCVHVACKRTCVRVRSGGGCWGKWPTPFKGTNPAGAAPPGAHTRLPATHQH